MKRNMLLNLLLSIGTALPSSVYAAESQLNEHLFTMGQENDSFNSDGQFKSQRVRTTFNRQTFLRDYNREFADSLGEVTFPKDKQSDEGLNNACWEALYKLKDHYKAKNDTTNYGFTYLNMAKFLVNHGVYPAAYISAEQQKDYHTKLRNTLGTILQNKNGVSTKLKKWAHIYEGMLFLDYVKQFPGTHRRERLLANAYHEFSKAVELKTTRTSYLLAAEVILDYGFIPEGMTKEEAEKLAYGYIDSACEKIENPAKKNPDALRKAREQSKPSALVKHARPAYLHDVGQRSEPKVHTTNSAHIRPILHSCEQETVNLGEPEVIIVPTNEIVDGLQDYDYSTLDILQHQNAANLPIRNYPLNRVGSLREEYTIDLKRFKRQNVSGQGLKCFFNAAGIIHPVQVFLLRRFANDPVVRYMIANEIVSAAANPHQLSPQVKAVINYELYDFQRKELDELDMQKNDLLASQNIDPNLQDVQELPAIYSTLEARGTEILEQLRRNALKFAAFNTFIEHDIKSERMMVALVDLQENENANFTSVDALAYINKVGIKIYQPDEGGLRLVHQYIPEGAEEVAYLYHENLHFQSLIPVEDEESSEPVSDIDDISNEGTLGDDVEEMVLDDSDHSEKDKRKCNKMTDENKEDLVSTYLRYYSDLQNGNAKYLAIIKPFAQKVEAGQSTINHYLRTKFLKGMAEETPELIEKYTDKVIEMYKKGKGFYAIKKRTKLSIETIVKIIREGVSPQEYRKLINLSEIKISLSDKEKENLVVNKFKELTNKSSRIANKKPSILAVHKALNEPGISYPAVKIILRGNGLVAKPVPVRHLTPEQQKNIRAEFARLNPAKGKLEATYKDLAKKYKVTSGQVRYCLENGDMPSKETSKYQEDRKKVKEAYKSLTVKQRKTPIRYIKNKLGLSGPTIATHLKDANLYKSDGKAGMAATNALVQDASVNQNKRKRTDEPAVNNGNDSNKKRNVSDK